MIKMFSIVFFVLFVIGVFASWFVAGALVAPVRETMDESKTNLPLQKVTINSESGSTLAGWLAEAQDSKGIVVLFHGVKGSRMAMLERAELFYKEGYTSILVDFQAHGESPGKNITVGYLEKFDVKATVDYARSRYPGAPIAVVGVSLGGASSILASPLNVEAVILESVYSNLRTAVHNRVKRILGPLSWLPAEILLVQLKPRLGFSPMELSPIDKIKNVDSPVYIISGKDDHHTTMAETQALFDNANEPKRLWLVDGVAHVDIYKSFPEEYKDKVLSFIDEHLQDDIE